MTVSCCKGRFKGCNKNCKLKPPSFDEAEPIYTHDEIIEPPKMPFVYFLSFLIVIAVGMVCYVMYVIHVKSNHGPEAYGFLAVLFGFIVVMVAYIRFHLTDNKG